MVDSLFAANQSPAAVCALLVSYVDMLRGNAASQVPLRIVHVWSMCVWVVARGA